MKRGVYPGSFNPPTKGHLAIMAAAIDQHQLDQLVLVVSRVALAKETVDRPRLLHRLGVLQRSVSHMPQVSVATTEQQLLVAIASGFDVLIMGADKWLQIQDPIFYNNSPEERDAAMAALPHPAIAPRSDLEIPAQFTLQVPDWVGAVSSSAARAGDTSQMTPEALGFDTETGAWTNPDRYDVWLSSQP